MVIGFLLALNMGAQDTVSPSLTPDYDFYTETIHCKTWQDVRLFRKAANKAGFGSVSKLKDDGSYDLSFVFVGDQKSTASQLVRLNNLLNEPLTMLEKPKAPSKSAENIAEESNQKEDDLDTEHAQINVSGKFEKTMVKDASTVSTEKPNQTDKEETNIGTIDASEAIALKTEEEKKKGDKALKDIEPAPKPKEQRTTKKFVTDSTPAAKPKAPSYTNQENQESKAQATTTSTANYAIIFGSFANKSNAYRLRDRLEEEGIQAKILPYNSVYRVGIPYNEYPRQAIKDFKSSHPQTWLLRND